MVIKALQVCKVIYICAIIYNLWYLVYNNQRNTRFYDLVNFNYFLKIQIQIYLGQQRKTNTNTNIFGSEKGQIHIQILHSFAWYNGLTAQ